MQNTEIIERFEHYLKDEKNVSANTLSSYMRDIRQLAAYLDTHTEDREAFAALQTVIRLSREGRRRYVEKYGPITVDDMRFAGEFTWADAPWPWQMCTGKEG